jgi:predicted NUDIX family NTP pyrophosphohydrolase
VKESAGTLLYRIKNGGLQVLIVHPSGDYNRRAPWSIPKGKLDTGESREAAARRETEEETGVRAGELVDLGSVELVRSRKRIYGFAGPAPDDAQPRCASWEVDRAEFVTVERARELLHPDQAPFVDWLVTLVGARKT